MQIIVQNEGEKKLFENFIDDIFVHQNNDQPDRNQTTPSLNSDEIRLLSHSFKEETITVDPSVKELTFSSDDIISQVFECNELNNETNIVTYSQYLEKQSQQMLKPWEQNACWNEEVQE